MNQNPYELKIDFSNVFGIIAGVASGFLQMAVDHGASSDEEVGIEMGKMWTQLMDEMNAADPLTSNHMVAVAAITTATLVLAEIMPDEEEGPAN